MLQNDSLCAHVLTQMPPCWNWADPGRVTAVNVAVAEEQDWFSVHRWDAEGATWTYLVVEAKEATLAAPFRLSRALGAPASPGAEDSDFDESLQWAVLTVLDDMMQLKYGCSMDTWTEVDGSVEAVEGGWL